MGSAEGLSIIKVVVGEWVSGSAVVAGLDLAFACLMLCARWRVSRLRACAVKMFFALLASICTIANAAPSQPTQGLWVTFDVQGERFRAVVDDAESVDYVLAFVEGQAPGRTPLAAVERGSGHNDPWSWHLTGVRFVEQASASCDAAPSSVDGLQQYCPRHARIVRVEDCRTGDCVVLRGLYAGRSPAI